MEAHNFLDKVVLLSSAVADADNHQITHGKKLESLSALELLIPKLSKNEITSAQKKLEDLCVRILFQNCPSILVRPIAALLVGMYTRGSSAGMHACVAFLCQLAVCVGVCGEMDRPLPFDTPRVLTVEERSACFSVAAAVVVSRGPSASYFVPNLVACVSKFLKCPNPAVRENALSNLYSVIHLIGIPSSVDVWKSFLHRCLVTDKSPQVRIAAAMCASVLRGAPSDSVQGVALKVVLAPFSAQESFLTELRNAHLEILVELLVSRISAREDSDDYSPTPTQPTTQLAGSIKSVVFDFATAMGWIFGTLKKYKGYPNAVGALVACAVRVALRTNREDDRILLGKLLVANGGFVADRAIARLVRACVGDSAVLRFAMEVFSDVVAGRTVVSSESTITCINGLTAVMCLVEGSIVSFSDDLPNQLLGLLTTVQDENVAVSVSYCLRVLCRVCPSYAFSITNVLLNQIRIHFAETAKGHLHACIALASVMHECANIVPREICGAIVSTASQLADWCCGFILLIGPVMHSIDDHNTLLLMSMWKSVLGKKSLEVWPSGDLEHRRSVFCGIQSLKFFLQNRPQIDHVAQLIVVFLNNVWQMIQMMPNDVTQNVSNIKSELYECLCLMDLKFSQSLHLPLIAYLSDELKSSGGYSASLCGGSSLCVDGEFATSVEFELENSPKDFFKSALSAGNLDEYYAMFPASDGSPFCPQTPYHLLNSREPLCVQMSHPLRTCDFFRVTLLGQLLTYTQTQAHMHVNHDSTDPTGTRKCLTLVCSIFQQNYLDGKNLNLMIILKFFAQRNCSNRQVLQLVVGVIRECDDVLVLQGCAVVVANMYNNGAMSEDEIAGFLTEFSTSKSAQIRGICAHIVGMLQFPQALPFLPILFQLGRELSLPVRVASLGAIANVCVCGQTDVAPYLRDILKITMAHAVADVFPFLLSKRLLCEIIVGILSISSTSSRSDKLKCDLLWSELKSLPRMRVDLSSVDAIRDLCVCYASRADPTNEIHGEYVLENITSKTAIEGFTEMCEQGLVLDDDAIYANLFSVSDLNPELRPSINRLLKVLVRMHKVAALDHILSALRVSAGTPLEEISVADEDDYGSDDEKPQKKKAPTVVRGPMNLATRALAVVCLKRILKQSVDVKLSHVDELVHIAASAAVTVNNDLLAIAGIKLLYQIVEKYKMQVDAKSGADLTPLLLQFETQIASAVRRGIKMNSEAPLVVQEISLDICQILILQKLTLSPHKLVELLVQPLVVVDPATMPWSTYFSLREAANVIVSGRASVAQSNETELSKILHARVRVVVNVMHTAHGQVGFTHIHYYLMRLLLDAALLISKVDGQFFSIKKRPEEPQIHTLCATVVSGLATCSSLGIGKVELPPDCPYSLDVEALFVGVAMGGVGQISAQAILLIAFEFGYPDFLIQHCEAKDDWLAEKIVDHHTEWALAHMELIARLSTEKNIIYWLYNHGFYSDVKMFVDTVYFEMISDLSAGIATWKQVEATFELFECLGKMLLDNSRDLKYLSVMIVVLNGEITESIRTGLLLRAANEDCTAVVQVVSKLTIYSEALLAIVIELVCLYNCWDLLAGFIQKFGSHTKFPSAQIVAFVLATENPACLLACMQAMPEAFRAAIGELSPEEKTRVQAVVQKHVTNALSAEEKPQIQLKLKFGSK